MTLTFMFQRRNQKMQRQNNGLDFIIAIFCVPPSGLSRLFTDITSLIYYQIGMSSACINPILYGYLNETFRKEFTAIAGPLKSCLENKVPACLKSKSNQEAEPEQALEIQPLEVKVQNGSSKVENKLIPRDPTSFNDKKMDLITVHNAKS